MIERAYHTLTATILTAWLLLWPVTWFVAPVGLWPCTIALALGLGLRFSPVGNYVLASIGHPSLALVVLAAAALAWQAGYETPASPLWAKLVFLGLSGLLYASIATVIRWDIYAWFYGRWPRFILLIALAAYCALAQDLFVAALVLGASLLTAARIGGSNPLDHLHHFLLMPIILVSLF